MKLFRPLPILALWLSVTALGAENIFTAEGNPYLYTPQAESGLEQVFVFNGLGSAKVSFQTDDPSLWQWKHYADDPLSAETVTAESDAASCWPSELKAGGYLLSDGSRTYSFYVVDYTEKPLTYADMHAVTEAEDIAVSLSIVLLGQMADFSYVGSNGTRVYPLPRTHTLTWTDAVWDDARERYADEEKTLVINGETPNFSVDAPLQDTYFEISGDQFASHFGLTPAVAGFDYQAVRADCSHATAKAQPKAAAANEIGGGDDGDPVSSGGLLTGSAPFTVEFESHPNPAATFCAWTIFTKPGSETSSIYHTDENVEHVFNEAGEYKVKLYVSGKDRICSDSASFTVKVTESMLDCPNFFSPRSTPGDNDEFRVAYKSLVKFHGRILNRWGNLLFEWTDPSTGWDGTYRGKPVNPGVYFYVITATGSDGIEYVKKGDINILE